MESSDIVITVKECPKCKAKWTNGQLYWSTGLKGEEKDLSNLVCGLTDDPTCINPIHKVGHVYGEADSWEKTIKQLINLLRLKMPRSNITRYEMLSKLYYLKDELKEREEDTENKYLADEYLNKVLDFINTFNY